jgi:hypothetical protein
MKVCSVSRALLCLCYVFCAVLCAPVFAQKQQPPKLPQLNILEKIPRKPATTIAEFGLTGVNKIGGDILRYRRHVPKSAPFYVVREIERTLAPEQTDTLRLELADSTAAGWFALYASPLNIGSYTNQEFRVRLYKPTATDTASTTEQNVAFELTLNDFFTRNDYLEVQDVRYDAPSGLVFFNEACITYAKDADGKCSSLMCVNPVTKKIVWSTPPLVSNNMFLLLDDVIVCGYGFTAEKDYAYTLDKLTGKILTKTFLESAADYFEVKDRVLYIVSYKNVYKVELPKP